jgi:hypothetical protein
VRHVVDRDLEKSLRDLLGRTHVPRSLRDLGRQDGELLADDRGVERQVPARPEDRRKQRWIDLADHHVAVGDRQRAAATVRRGAGVRTGRFRADAKARAVEPADRAATGRYGVNLHHRRAQPHARDFGHESALVFAGVMRDIGRRAAHVETDDAIEAREPHTRPRRRRLGETEICPCPGSGGGSARVA